MNVLETANKITQGDRRKDYGSPSLYYKRLAFVWSVLLDREVTPHEVALCMIAMKLIREKNNHKLDNLVDIAGYARTIEMMDEELSTTPSGAN